jgi:hypothetical protein
VPTAFGLVRADTLTAGLPRRAWQRLSAGAGAKGERFYDWALVTVFPPADPTPDDPDTQCWWLFVRRHHSSGGLAFYRCFSLQPVPLRELVRFAGRRWTVFAMLAHALLAVITANEHAARPAPDGLIALTCNGTRRLLIVLVVEPARALACPEAWSTWRRRHQHRARTSHYQRQHAAAFGWS